MKKKIGNDNKNSVKFTFIILISILATYLLLNLSLLPDGGYTEDIAYFQGLGNTALSNGVSSLYPSNVIPPVTPYILKFNSWLSLNLFGNNIVLSKGYVVIHKLTPLICNVLIGLCIFFYLKKSDYQKALLGLILYLFNLAVIYNASYWGQLESINSLFIVISILFLVNERYALSSIALIISILIKMQSAFLIPIVWTVIFLKCGYKKILNIILIDFAAIILLLIPYIIAGGIFNIIKIYTKFVDHVPLVTVNAYNIWLFVSLQAPDLEDTALSDQFIFLGFSLKYIGLFILSLYASLVIYQLFKQNNKEQIVLASTSMALAFFILPTQIHERYMFYMFPLFVLFLTISYSNKYLNIYLTLFTTHLLNLMMVLNYSGKNFIFQIIQSNLNLIINKISFLGLALILAIINVFVFIYFSKVGIFNNLLENLKEDINRIKRQIIKNDETMSADSPSSTRR